MRTQEQICESDQMVRWKELAQKMSDSFINQNEQAQELIRESDQTFHWKEQARRMNDSFMNLNEKAVSEIT